MDEEAARRIVVEELGVSRETMAKLSIYADLLREESHRQNLISAQTLPTIWSRHILDSAQLTGFRRSDQGTWLDLGSGAGLPGLVVAAMHQGRVTLLEQRRLRTTFLQSAVEAMDMTAHCYVVTGRAEGTLLGTFDIISARAVAPLKKLLEIGHRFAHSGTRWILPKGRSAQSELDALAGSWQGEFRLEPSMTDPAAQIIIADKVEPSRRGSVR